MSWYSVHHQNHLTGSGSSVDNTGIRSSSSYSSSSSSPLQASVSAWKNRVDPDQIEDEFSGAPAASREGLKTGASALTSASLVRKEGEGGEEQVGASGEGESGVKKPLSEQRQGGSRVGEGENSAASESSSRLMARDLWRNEGGNVEPVGGTRIEDRDEKGIVSYRGSIGEWTSKGWQSLPKNETAKVDPLGVLSIEEDDGSEDFSQDQRGSWAFWFVVSIVCLLVGVVFVAMKMVHTWKLEGMGWKPLREAEMSLI